MTIRRGGLRVGWLHLIWIGIGLLMSARSAEREFAISSRVVRDDVRAVVEAQLAALRAGNFDEAYALASRGIRARFDEWLFAAMMRRGYSPLLRAKNPDIGIVRDRAGEEAQVTVELSDERGRVLVYRYWLVREREGWRVNGVVAEQLPARGDV